MRTDQKELAGRIAVVNGAARGIGRGIDILANNAGITLTRPFTETTEEEWDRVIDVNLSSISGRRGRPLAAAYAASKAAVICITQSAALFFDPYHILVNAVSPSVVPTAMWETIDRDKGRYTGFAPGMPSRRWSRASR